MAEWREIMARCECTACEETFRSEVAFDKHREGKYTIPSTRKCLTKRQMESKGMVNRNGWGGYK